MQRLAGKTALITGAARGIGRAFGEAYAREGASVAIADINLGAAEKTAGEIGKRATAVAMDVTKQESIDAAVTETVGRLGRIDILVNNAALFTLQAVARHMIERGEGGKIINMASQAGRRGEPLVAVYCATKAAVISLTQSAGLNLIRHGINVNAISPGVVDGEHWDGVDAFFARHENKLPGQKKKEVGAAVPFGRMGTADDLTGMAIFLASSEADYIVAQTYNVDGGNWMN